MHGSGHFIVSCNDSSIIDFKPKDREVLVYPKATGLVEITIEDFELPDSLPATTYILVSDIEKL